MKHPFHIVDPSPWPATGAAGTLFILAGIASWVNKHDNKLATVGLLIILITIAMWWRDVNREATYQGKHTNKVEKGIRMGMILFIIREIFFFFSFFWAFFHSSLGPNVEIGSAWPPTFVRPVNPFEVPLLNTTVLLSRGATITWAHMSLLNSNWRETRLGLTYTIGLGILFTALQLQEYERCSFTITDSVYGRTFYVATGFHGLHVIIGTLFISVTLCRHLGLHFSSEHHFGFEGRAWYWHFVDVVWLFLFICIYWWGC